MRSDWYIDSKMPSSEASSLSSQTEKPRHYTYLKEFRTQQCAQFLQHKCTQHRPFTCFHWHFMNQRRRRPVRKRDGTFSYSPDVYCTKYDETTGICPDGDECQFLHRTAGDTERRYHLRYYKTSVCVHETDSRGHCVKNGPHCAFAHGALDMRPPAYDIRELQAADGSGRDLPETPLGSSLEKDRIINDDPRWNDTNYVLANYKTEQCKRPPRLCRQGYACPSFHNTRDKRRSPRKFKYRSTPCPNVKHGDDWGDPTQCENGENCPYCHTRTEQQFHPEIYKSSKCNDMVQTGYCPRGPFCAFAHVEQEMTTQRDMVAVCDNSLAAFVTNALPPASIKEEGRDNGRREEAETNNNDSQKGQPQQSVQPLSSIEQTNGTSHVPSLSTSTSGLESTVIGWPEPIGKGRSSSMTSSMSSSLTSDGSVSMYRKAPGSERDDVQLKLKQQMQIIDGDHTLDSTEKTKRKQNLLLLHSLNHSNNPLSSMLHSNLAGSSITTTSNVPVFSSSIPASSMSPLAPSFYPAGDTVESVIGNALDEDLNLGTLSLGFMDRELGVCCRDNDDTNSVCSSSTGLSTSYIGATSVPVTIPSGGYQRGSVGSLSQSPTPSPLGGSFTLVPQHVQQQQKQEQQLQEAAAAFLSRPNPGKFSAPGYCGTDFSNMSPHNGISQSPLASSLTSNGFGETQHLREELAASKAKLVQWEEGIHQARSACEAWKKEAEEATKKMNLMDEERRQAYKQRDEAVNEVIRSQREVEQLRGSPFLHCLQRVADLDALPIAHLKQLQVQLRMDLDLLEKALFKVSYSSLDLHSLAQTGDSTHFSAPPSI